MIPVNCDHASVECAIMERAWARPVARVCTKFLRDVPGNDMAGVKKLAKPGRKMSICIRSSLTPISERSFERGALDGSDRHFGRSCGQIGFLPETGIRQ